MQDVASTSLSHIPRDLPAMLMLCVADCLDLDANWLPQSSSQCLTDLNVAGTRLTALPAGLGALKCVRVANCRKLSHSWLPASSCAQLVIVDARGSNLHAVPRAAPALTLVLVAAADCRTADGVLGARPGVHCLVNVPELDMDGPDWAENLEVGLWAMDACQGVPMIA